MKIEVKKETLLRNLLKVERGIGKLGSLAGIKLEARDNKLVLTSTNDLFTIQSLICEERDCCFSIYKEGEVLLLGRHLVNIIKQIDSAVIELETKDNATTIKGGNSKFNLKHLDLKNYPKYRKREYNQNFKMRSLELKVLIEKVINATSKQNIKPLLQGVNFKATKEENLIFIATDRFRIARCEHEIKEDNNIQFLENEIDITIPDIALNELLKIIEGGEVEISFDSINAKFSFNNTIFETRLIAGAFPKVHQLFGKFYPIEVVYNRKDIIKAIERVTILLNNSNVIILNIGRGETIIYTKENEYGEAKEVVLNSEQDEEIEFAISSEYLLDALKTFDDEEVVLKIEEPLKPIEISSQNVFNTKHIIFPVRVL